MEQTLNLLILILGAIQLIDIIIAITLYFIYGKNNNFLLVALMWVGMCSFFLGDALLGPLGLNHVYLSYSFAGISSIAMAKLVCHYYAIEFYSKYFFRIYIGSLVLALIFRIAGNSDFFTQAIIASVGVVSPVLFSAMIALNKLIKKRVKHQSSIDYIFVTVVFIWGGHYMDYPFLRPLADLKFSIFGFSFALVLTYLTSILLPVLINRRIHLELNDTLEDKLIKKNSELDKAQEQIIAREKLASLGALAAGIAHEIKNPLNIIKNGALLINQFIKSDLRKYPELFSNDPKSFEEKLKDDTKRLEDVAALVDKNAQRADNIVRNMLVQSRSGKSSLKSIDLNELVLQSLNFVRESTKAKYPFEPEIRLEFTPVGMCNLYEDDLTRALINIFDNALYALYSKYKKDAFVPTLWVRTFLETEYFVIEIEDNGPGISKEIYADIMNPFFTTKPTGEGTGLGLSMAFDVMKMHEGDIFINSESNEDSFTIFTLKISKCLADKD